MTKNLLLSISFLIWLAGCTGPHGVRSAESAPALSVEVVRVSAQQWPSHYEATGTVRARTSTVISAKWMGYVREVKVQLGDRVRAGELLVALDARDLDATSSRAAAARQEVRDALPEADSAIQAAKADLDLAQATFRRMNELFGKKSISDQEFDEASAKLKAAQAAYQIMRAKRTQLDAKLAEVNQEVRATEVTRSYAQVQAPFAGVVTAKPVEPGNLAVPGAPLLTIEGESYRFEASVEQSRLASIHQGQAASVAIDGISQVFDSRVSEIVPAVDEASRAYTVKIDLPRSTALRSGIFGRAVFQLGTRSVVSIPCRAASERGQLQSVFVFEDGVARTRLVTLGEKGKGQVEILSGLNAGENVIFPIPQGITDGTRVEAKP